MEDKAETGPSSSVELRGQLTFKGTAINDATGKLCEPFVSNPWKKSRCKNCGHDMRDHISSAVSDSDVLAGIAEDQSKDGANVILEAADGMGSLHLGGFMASGQNYVEQQHITHVVNAAAGLEKFFVRWAKQLPVLEENGVTFLRLGWYDTNSQRLWKDTEYDQLGEAIEFIHTARKNGGNVVVHCAQGKSRSAAVVVAYLMAINPEPIDSDTALVMIQRKRPMAEPNSYFQNQLREFKTSAVLREKRSDIHG